MSDPDTNGAGGPIVRDTDELIDALASRREALGLSNEALEDIAGLAPGHVSKLLGPMRAKRPNLATLDVLLGALGVSFQLIEDPAKMALMKGLWEQRQAGAVRSRVGRAIRRALPPYVTAAEKGRMGGKKRWEGSSPEQRSAACRAAAQARWSRAAPATFERGP